MQLRDNSREGERATCITNKILLAGGIAGLSILLSPSAHADDATSSDQSSGQQQLPQDQSLQSSQQNQTQTTSNSSLTPSSAGSSSNNTTLTPEIAQINSVLNSIPTPSQTVTDSVQTAVTQVLEANTATQTAAQTQTTLDAANSILATTTTEASTAATNLSTAAAADATAQAAASAQTAVVAADQVAATSSQAAASAANTSSTITETFDNNTTHILTITTGANGTTPVTSTATGNVSIGGSWNTPQTSGPGLVLMGATNDVVINVNPNNTGTATKVEMGVYAKNGDTTMTATNADGTTVVEVINNNVSSQTQAVQYTSVESVTGTNIKTLTITKDSDYYIIDNIKITKSSSDPALVQAALDSQAALAIAQAALAALQADASTTAASLAAAQASATQAQTNLTTAALAASQANTADVAADKNAIVQTTESQQAVANAQVVISAAAISAIQTQLTATQTTANNLPTNVPVASSVQAAIDNAQAKITDASTAIAEAEAKKTQADGFQSAAGVNVTVESATATVEDKTAIVLVAQDAVEAQQVVVTDAQTAKNQAQTVVDTNTSPGLKVTTYAYGGGNAPALPAPTATPLSTYVDTNGISESWGGGQVANSGRADRVIVKYEGDITLPVAGTIGFYAPADDGTKVIIDNMQIINDWRDKGGGGSTVTKDLNANTSYSFTLWYYENGGGASVSFMWNLGQGFTVVPGSAFATSNATQEQKNALATAVTNLTTATTELTTLQATETQANQNLTSAQATLVLATSAELARTEYAALAQTAIDKTVEAVAAVSDAAGAVSVYVPATFTANDAASLSSAITLANATPANDTIILSGGATLTENLPTITKDVTIQGQGQDATTVNADGHTAFTVRNSATVTISDLTISNASTALNNSSGNVTLDKVTITSGSTGVSQMGSGVTTLTHSVIIANQVGITSDYGSTPSDLQSDETQYTNRIYVDNTSFVYNNSAISTERFVAVDSSTFFGNDSAASLRGLNKVSVTNSNFITNGVAIETFSWQPSSWEVDLGNRTIAGNTFTDNGTAISLNDYLNNGTQSNATANIENNTFNLSRGKTAISSPTNDYTVTDNKTVYTYIDAPTNVQVAQNNDGSVTVTWEAPASGATPERYAVSWSVDGQGWGIATGNAGDANALNTSIVIPASLFETSGGLDKTYTITVRADNDSLTMYSSQVAAEVLVADPTPPLPPAPPTPEPAIPQPTDPTPQPPIPDPEPVAPVEPPLPVDPSPVTPDPVPVDPTPVDPAPVDPTPVDPQPPVEPVDPTPVDPTPVTPDPVTPDVSPGDNNTPTPAEVKAEVADALADGKLTANEVSAIADSMAADGKVDAKETSQLVEALSADGKLTTSEVSSVLDALAGDGDVSKEDVAAIIALVSGDGNLTNAEKTIVADALIQEFAGEKGVDVNAIAAAGIDLADLPPETPIELVNGVVITAELGNAFETLANPSELVGAVFSDPGQVLLALGSLGDDMSTTEREESQKIVVATIIAAGAAVQAAVNAAGSAAQLAASSTSSSSGGPSGGGSSKGGGTGGPAAPRNDAGAPLGKEGGNKPKKTVKKQNKIRLRRRPK